MRKSNVPVPGVRGAGPYSIIVTAAPLYGVKVTNALSKEVATASTFDGGIHEAQTSILNRSKPMSPVLLPPDPINLQVIVFAIPS